VEFKLTEIFMSILWPILMVVLLIAAFFKPRLETILPKILLGMIRNFVIFAVLSLFFFWTFKNIFYLSHPVLYSYLISSFLTFYFIKFFLSQRP